MFKRRDPEEYTFFEIPIKNQKIRAYEYNHNHGTSNDISSYSNSPPPHPAQRIEWINIIKEGLGHRVYVIDAIQNAELRSSLILAEVTSPWFGRFLVSLPYLNYGGIQNTDIQTANSLISAATTLTDLRKARFLELRHKKEVHHPLLSQKLTSKIQMRLALPDNTNQMWDLLKSKVRNQIRKAAQNSLNLAWGRSELLNDFYRVYCENMRDLGTPCYHRKLFSSIINNLSDSAEICCVYKQKQPIASALIIHGGVVSEVPTAAALRSERHTNANMLMYWNLICRTIEKNNQVFDFGRSTINSGSYRFKAQWGAKPRNLLWQYYVRAGAFDDMRLESGRYSKAVAMWKRLPISLTRWIGPQICRGIP